MTDHQQGRMVQHGLQGLPLDQDNGAYDNAAAHLDSAPPMAFQNDHSRQDALVSLTRTANEDSLPMDPVFDYNHHWLRRPRMGSGESFSTDKTSRPVLPAETTSQPIPLTVEPATVHGLSSSLSDALTGMVRAASDVNFPSSWSPQGSAVSTQVLPPSLALQRESTASNVLPRGVDVMDWDSDERPLHEQRSPASESSTASSQAAYMPTSEESAVSAELLRNLGISPAGDSWWIADNSTVGFESPPPLRLSLPQTTAHPHSAQELRPHAIQSRLEQVGGATSPPDTVASRRSAARSPTATMSAQTPSHRRRFSRIGDTGGPGPIRPSNSHPTNISGISPNDPLSRRRSGTIASTSYQQTSNSPISTRNSHELYSSRELRAVMSTPSFQPHPSLTRTTSNSQYAPAAESRSIAPQVREISNMDSTVSRPARDAWPDDGSEGMQRQSSLSVHLASMALHAGARVSAANVGDFDMRDQQYQTIADHGDQSRDGSHTGGDTGWTEDEASFLSNDTSASAGTSYRDDDSSLFVRGRRNHWRSTPQSSPASSQIYQRSSHMSVEEPGHHQQHSHQKDATDTWSSHLISSDRRERLSEYPSNELEASLARNSQRGGKVLPQRPATQSSHNSEHAEAIAEEEEMPVSQSSQTWPRARTLWGEDTRSTQQLSAHPQGLVGPQQRRNQLAFPRYGSSSTVSSTSSSIASGHSSADRRIHAVHTRGGPQPTLAQMLASGDSASDRSIVSSAGTASTTSSSSPSAMRGSVAGSSRRSSHELGSAGRNQGASQHRGMLSSHVDQHGVPMASARIQDAMPRDRGQDGRRHRLPGDVVSQRGAADQRGDRSSAPSPVHSVLSSRRGHAVVEEAARRERSARVGYNEVSAALDTLRSFLRQRERDNDWIQESDSRRGSVHGSAARSDMQSGDPAATSSSGRHRASRDGEPPFSPSGSGSGGSDSGSASPGGSSSRPRTLRRTHGTLPPRGSVQIDDDERGAIFTSNEMNTDAPRHSVTRQPPPFHDISSAEHQSLAVLSDLSERVTMLRQNSQRWANQDEDNR